MIFFLVGILIATSLYIVNKNKWFWAGVNTFCFFGLGFLWPCENFTDIVLSSFFFLWGILYGNKSIQQFKTRTMAGKRREPSLPLYK